MAKTDNACVSRREHRFCRISRSPPIRLSDCFAAGLGVYRNAQASILNPATSRRPTFFGTVLQQYEVIHAGAHGADNPSIFESRQKIVIPACREYAACSDYPVKAQKPTRRFKGAEDMKYILMMAGAKAGVDAYKAWSEKDIQKHFAHLMDINKELKESGEFVANEGLGRAGTG